MTFRLFLRITKFLRRAARGIKAVARFCTDFARGYEKSTRAANQRRYNNEYRRPVQQPTSPAEEADLVDEVEEIRQHDYELCRRYENLAANYNRMAEAQNDLKKRYNDSLKKYQADTGHPSDMPMVDENLVRPVDPEPPRPPRPRRHYGLTPYGQNMYDVQMTGCSPSDEWAYAEVARQQQQQAQQMNHIPTDTRRYSGPMLGQVPVNTSPQNVNPYQQYHPTYTPSQYQPYCQEQYGCLQRPWYYDNTNIFNPSGHLKPYIGGKFHNYDAQYKSWCEWNRIASGHYLHPWEYPDNYIASISTPYQSNQSVSRPNQPSPQTNHIPQPIPQPVPIVESAPTPTRNYSILGFDPTQALYPARSSVQAVPMRQPSIPPVQQPSPVVQPAPPQPMQDGVVNPFSNVVPNPQPMQDGVVSPFSNVIPPQPMMQDGVVNPFSNVIPNPQPMQDGVVSPFSNVGPQRPPMTPEEEIMSIGIPWDPEKKRFDTSGLLRRIYDDVWIDEETDKYYSGTGHDYDGVTQEMIDAQNKKLMDEKLASPVWYLSDAAKAILREHDDARMAEENERRNNLFLYKPFRDAVLASMMKKQTEEKSN